MSTAEPPEWDEERECLRAKYAEIEVTQRRRTICGCIVASVWLMVGVPLAYWALQHPDNNLILAAIAAWSLPLISTAMHIASFGFRPA